MKWQPKCVFTMSRTSHILGPPPWVHMLLYYFIFFWADVFLRAKNTAQTQKSGSHQVASGLHLGHFVVAAYEEMRKMQTPHFLHGCDVAEWSCKFDVPVCTMIKEKKKKEIIKSTKSGGGQRAALTCSLSSAVFFFVWLLPDMFVVGFFFLLIPALLLHQSRDAPEREDLTPRCLFLTDSKIIMCAVTCVSKQSCCRGDETVISL